MTRDRQHADSMRAAVWALVSLLALAIVAVAGCPDSPRCGGCRPGAR